MVARHRWVGDLGALRAQDAERLFDLVPQEWVTGVFAVAAPAACVSHASDFLPFRGLTLRGTKACASSRRHGDAALS